MRRTASQHSGEVNTMSDSRAIRSSSAVLSTGAMRNCLSVAGRKILAKTSNEVWRVRMSRTTTPTFRSRITWAISPKTPGLILISSSRFPSAAARGRTAAMCQEVVSTYGTARMAALAGASSRSRFSRSTGWMAMSSRRWSSAVNTSISSASSTTVQRSGRSPAPVV